ncbi:hypothetical protein D3C79_1026170 [compost metagenome]
MLSSAITFVLNNSISNIDFEFDFSVEKVFFKIVSNDEVNCSYEDESVFISSISLRKLSSKYFSSLFLNSSSIVGFWQKGQVASSLMYCCP